MRHLLAAAAAALSLASVPALAWGPEGHSSVGGIADRLLAGTPAGAKVGALMQPGESLAVLANWADCAKGPRVCNADLTPEMQAFVTAHPQHREYHYTDLSIARAAYQPRLPGTAPHDIVHVLNQAVAAMRGDRDPWRNPGQMTPRQGLLMAAHLVGDLHQPLHVGAVYLDAQGKPVDPVDDPQVRATTNDGGNKLHIDGQDAKLLHSYWDFDIVKVVFQKEGVSTYGDFVTRALAADPSVIAITDTGAAIQAWTDESLANARTVLQPLAYGPKRSYAPRNNQPVEGWDVRMPPDVQDRDAALARKALVLGGKRLAALLRATFEPAAK